MQQTYKIPAHFPTNSRIWIFIGERKLDTTEINWLNESLTSFVSSWQTHGKSLDAVGFVIHEAAILICANEHAVKASGCSMDKINHFVKNAGTTLSVDFFNRKNVLLPTDNDAFEIGNFDITSTRMIHSAMGKLEELEDLIH